MISFDNCLTLRVVWDPSGIGNIPSLEELFNVLLIKQGLLSLLTSCGSPIIVIYYRKWLLAMLIFSPKWAVA